MAVDGIAPVSGTSSPTETGSSSPANTGNDFARELTAAEEDEIIDLAGQIFLQNYMLFDPMAEERSELASV